MPNSIEQDRDDDTWTTQDGHHVVIRPIRGDDKGRMSRFHCSLSPETVYTRYFNALKLSERISSDRLDRICHPSSCDETVLIVETAEPSALARDIIAVGRLSVLADTHTGEIAFIVADSYQQQGIGTELLRQLLSVARTRKLSSLCAHVLPTNVSMQRICLNSGMHLIGSLTDSEVTAEINFGKTLQARPARITAIESLARNRLDDTGSEVVPLRGSVSVTKLSG